MGAGTVLLVGPCAGMARRCAPSAEFGYFRSEDGVAVFAAGGGVGAVAAGVVAVPEEAVMIGVRTTVPQAEAFFPSVMTARRREDIGAEVGGGPAAFDNIGSGKRVSRRFASSTLGTCYQIM